MTLYGLTCGYWTNDPEDLDTHVVAHYNTGKDDNLFDLFEEDRLSPEPPPLHICSEGVQ